MSTVTSFDRLSALDAAFLDIEFEEIEEFDDGQSEASDSDDGIPGHVDSDSEDDVEQEEITEWVRKLQPEVEQLSDDEVNGRLVDKLLSRKSVAFNTMMEVVEG